MSYRTVTRDLGCKYCGASGKRYTYEDLGGGDSGSINGTETCSDCQGRKTHRVMLMVSDESCDARGSWSPRFPVCQNGTMRNSESGYEYGKNFWGQETRKKIEVGQESEPCPFCFGTGKKHYMAKKQSCSKCGGWGELTESRWEKGFFGGEVKKEYRSTCPECRGSKFSWVIAHELRNSQIEKSNL
jgi:RecJ-like exonuclease